MNDEDNDISFFHDLQKKKKILYLWSLVRMNTMYARWSQMNVGGVSVYLYINNLNSLKLYLSVSL